MQYLRNKNNKLLADLRPVAVSLVDSFDIDDQSLLSTLGAYDGQVIIRVINKLNEIITISCYFRSTRECLTQLWRVR